MKVEKLSRLFCPAASLVFAASAWAAPIAVKVGVYLPMTGSTATFGEEDYNGLKLAVDEINAKGKVKIDLKLEDDKSETTDAANAAKKLISVDKVDVLIGSVTSSNSNAAAPIAQAAKVPMLSPAATNVDVTKRGEYISRICYVDEFQGQAAAKFVVNTLLKGRRPPRAAVIFDSEQDYSRGLKTSFIDAFQKLGGKIVTEVSYGTQDKDFSSQLTKVRLSKPDVVFAPGYYTGIGNLIRQAREQKINVPFVGGDGWSSPKLYELGGEAIIGNYFTDHFAPDDPSPKVQDFVKKYKERFKAAPGSMAALGYDAGYVVADAILRAGKADKEAIKNAINTTKNFVGVTGTITLDKNRNASKPLVVLETQRNTAVFKDRISP